jgi:hypothetical protein
MANCWPEDTDNEMYLPWECGEYSLQDLIEQAQGKWFGIDFKDLYVSSTRIQTSGCGCHPAWDDYTSFIVLTRKKTPKEGE